MSDDSDRTRRGNRDPAVLRKLLDNAWDQPPERRRAWLSEHCDDPELLAEAESLLEADEAAGDFLGPENAAYAAGLLEQPAYSMTAGRVQIGKYRIVEPIARGGMGEVYLAERAGGDFEQTVAIKLSQRFEDTPDQRRRFTAEQKILAQLEHPNIARLIDGGIWEGDEFSADGRPYLVMEYVDGQPITDYCAKGGLGLDDRLTLFMRVCEAVHYAHRNLVLHRDLKPSNILVSRDGRVKLLDFGIATMLAEEGGAATANTALMTPEFAAPEQIRGKPLTTSTDVYALGLLLYELVTNQRAHRLQGATPAEVERLVCDTQPVRPRAALRAGDSVPWARRVSTDLETIILKAMSVEPERRYASARALAEDLANFQAGRPVAAQPDSRRYRLRKFILRHRWQTAAAAGAILLLVAAVVMTSLSASRARQALEESRIEAAKSNQVVEFLQTLFAAADPRQTGGEKLTVQDVLETGTARIDALSAQPEVQGLLLSELGRIHVTLGNYDTALRMLRRALEIQRNAGPPDPALARTLHRLAIATDEVGDLEAAERYAREALEVRRVALPEDHPDVGESLDRLGAIIAGLGRYDEAEALLEQAVAGLVRNAGEGDRRTLTAMHNLAWLKGRRGKHAEAEALYRTIVHEATLTHAPNDPELLVSRDSLAVTLRRRGQLEEAETIFRDVLARRLETLGEGHREVGYTQHNLARLLVERGEHAGAVPLFEQALANWKTSLGPDHPNRGIGLSNLGLAYEEIGEPAKAEESYRRAIEILTQPGAGYVSRLADASLRLGRLLTERGDPDGASAFLEHALTLRETRHEQAVPLAEARLELGHCLMVSGRTDEGAGLLEQALPVLLDDPAVDDELRVRAEEISRQWREDLVSHHP